MSEKPLHVQVAEALGTVVCECVQDEGRSIHGTCWSNRGFEGIQDIGTCWSCAKREPGLLPKYDTDWAAGGPLVERFRIWLNPCECKGEQHWVGYVNGMDDGIEETTPLRAVCQIVLHLTERPLRVQVAEALGWTDFDPGEYATDGGTSRWGGIDPTWKDGPRVAVPNYDTSWSAGGPLIETLRARGFQLLARDTPAVATGKRCCAYIMGTAEGWGQTELEAVCRLVLQLKTLKKL